MAVNKPDSNKKWHQQWWGIIVLIGIVIIFISGAAFVFFLVKEIQAQTQVYLAQYQQVQAGDIDLAPTASFPRELIETSDDPSLGPVNAPVVIVEFADFQCPYCKQAQPVLKRIVEAYPLQVKIIYRDLPNTLGHPQAFNAALAGECADEQGQFWAYHDLIYTNQDNLTEDLFKTLAWQSGLNQEQFDQCFDQKKYQNEVMNDLVEGSTKYFVNATPTLFINGQKFIGSISFENLKNQIDKILQNTND